MTITNIELQELFDKKLVLLTDIVMSNDLLNLPKKKTMNIIINLDTKSNEGTHWVGLAIRDMEAFYYDSFGAKCDKYVIEYCKRHRLKLAINTYIIQDLKSTQCGIFCFGYFLFLKKERILKDVERQHPKSRLYELSNNFVNMFDPDTTKNDILLFNYIR